MANILRLRDLRRGQLEKLATELEAQMRHERRRAIEAESAHDTLFKLVLGHLRRDRRRPWQGLFTGRDIEAIRVPKTAFEADVKGWRLRFDPQGDDVVVTVVRDETPDERR